MQNHCWTVSYISNIRLLEGKLLDEVSFYHVGMLKTINPTHPTASNRTTACWIYIYYLFKIYTTILQAFTF